MKNLPETLQDKAKHLAFLLVQSVMPQEQKEGWINLLPLMSDQQVDALIEVLEQEHANYTQVSQDFLTDLKKLETTLSKKMQKLEASERELIDRFIHQKLSEYQAS